MPLIQLPQAVKYILDTLSNHGYEAYIVGGCIRDALSGKTPHDYDITTNATPDETAAVFSAYPQTLTGKKHGTIGVVMDHQLYEITTFRHDGGYTDHRHPDCVSFTTSLKDDLARRDFTINAMAYNPTVGLIDCYSGQQDLADGIIRCVGDPNIRFTEDALRIMRALRLAAEYNYSIHPQTAEAIHQHKELLQQIAVERISAELNRLLVGPTAAAVLGLWQDVFAFVIPELKTMFDFDQNNYHHSYDLWRHTLIAVDSVPADLPLRWTALLHDLGKPETMTTDANNVSHFHGHPAVSAKIARKILTRLHNSSQLINQVCLLITAHDNRVNRSDLILRQTLVQMGSLEMFNRLLAFQKADNTGQSLDFAYSDTHWEQLSNRAKQLIEEGMPLKVTDLKIDGNQLMDLGYQGPQISQQLQRLFTAVIDGQIKNEKTQLVEYLRSSK